MILYRFLQKMATIHCAEQFWKTFEGSEKKTLTQLERYKAAAAPEYITKFIEIGGGPKMGTTLEKYARFHFKTLKVRSKGKEETGYDHLLTVKEKPVYIEQKSSGYWIGDNFKWQHVESGHKWTMLLLCGIEYNDVKFWGMNRATFNTLIAEKKITNQGNKAEDSSEGMWFWYSDVKDSLVELKTDADLLAFAEGI